METMANPSTSNAAQALTSVQADDLSALSVPSSRSVVERVSDFFTGMKWRAATALALLACTVAPKASASLFAGENGPEGPLPLTTPFVPNDPYAPQQWHLDKTGTGAAVDINVKPAWERGLTGAGVLIGFVDTGVQYTHPDLSHIDLAHSWDFIEGDSDPIQFSGAHGTAVAGLASARGGNGIGVTGVAPYSNFAMARAYGSFDFSDTPSINKFAAAILHHAAGDNPAINIKSLSFVEVDSFGQVSYPAVNAINNAIREVTAAGTVFVTIAGNERMNHGKGGADGDAGKKHATSLPEAITVTAVDHTGRFAAYSNWGACVTAAVPSGETIWKGGVNLTTTDTLGAAGYNPNNNDVFPDQDYTTVFTGTSAAAPIMSGALALAMEAHRNAFGSDPSNPTRYYKHLLAKTCQITDPTDASATGGWTTNGAGYHFNPNYGFGLLDVDALTLAAASVEDVSPLTVNTTGLISVDKFVPSFNTTGITGSFFVSADIPLEEVLFRVLFNQDTMSGRKYSYGELGILLESPSGTKSMLSFPNSLANVIWDANFHPLPLDWTFTSNAFWGENPFGEWSFSVYNPFGGSYKLSSIEAITRHGEVVPEPSTTMTLGVGALTLLAFRRRRS